MGQRIAVLSAAVALLNILYLAPTSAQITETKLFVNGLYEFVWIGNSASISGDTAIVGSYGDGPAAGSYKVQEGRGEL